MSFRSLNKTQSLLTIPLSFPIISFFLHCFVYSSNNGLEIIMGHCWKIRSLQATRKDWITISNIGNCYNAEIEEKYGIIRKKNPTHVVV